MWRRWQFVAALAVAALLGTTAALWLAMINADQRLQIADARAERINATAALERELSDQRQRLLEIEQRLAQEETRRSSLEEELAARPPSQPTSVSFLLALGSVRDVEQFQRIVVPSAIDFIHLRFDLPAGAEAGAYRLAIQTVDDLAIWGEVRQSAPIAAGGRAVEATVPGRILPSGQYLARLQLRTMSGVLEDVGSSSFAVIRR